MFVHTCRMPPALFGGIVIAGFILAPGHIETRAAPLQESKSVATDASAQDVVQAYRVNAALADERYTDKRVAVTGRMIRITGVKVDGGAVYLLEMSHGVPNSKFYLTFRFTHEERKELAPLKEDQVVTIEGICKGLAPREPDDRQSVYFWDCKLVKTGK